MQTMTTCGLNDELSIESQLDELHSEFFHANDNSIENEPQETLSSDEIEAGVVTASNTGAKVMSKEAFYLSLKGLLHAPNKIAGMGLQTLEDAAESGELPEVADAIYDTCLEVVWLQDLLTPTNKWVARAVIILPFVFKLGIGIKQEMAARKEQTIEGQAAANDNI